MDLKAVISLLRPNQWVKNLVAFGALVFAKEFTDPGKVKASLLAFVILCLLSSVVYIVNDIFDRNSDRAHPVKRNRPIASGRITIFFALSLALVLTLSAIAMSLLLPVSFVYLVIVFLVFNFLYSMVLKRVVIIDVMAIAVSFVIRAAAGSAAIEVPNSSWLVVCTFLLALFIGFGKRRHELITLKQDAANHRSTLKQYSPYFLDQLIAVVTASTVVAYTFYTLSPEVKSKLGVNHLELTIPFVIYGIFRYLYLIHQEEKGGSPSKLLISDGPILINILLWFSAVIAIFHLLGE